MPGSGTASTLKKLSDVNNDLAARYLRSARETLQDLLQVPNLLDGIKLERVPGGYTRNLLFGDASMSVWAIVWAPGARTSIHDHHCSCCFAMLSGSMREVWFDAVGDAEAVVRKQAVRGPGYIACMMPSGPNIHQMLNDGPDEAISIHIYGFDHRQHASSILREYTLAAR